MTRILALVVLAACAPAPGPMLYGAESCEQCRMTVSEPGFAARALLTTGKAHAFDSVECLAAWAGQRPADAPRLHSLWVQDFDDPERWLPAAAAAYVQGGAVRSPMGGAITAHASPEAARAHADTHGGAVMEWGTMLLRATMGGGHAHAH
jgi:copper chaperone NosL